MDDRASIIAALTDFFSSKPSFSLVLLYGSFAKGTSHKNSDVDIAFHADSPLSVQELMDLHAALTLLLSRDVDLLDLRSAEGVILCQVLKNGVRIKYCTDVFVSYNLKAIYFTEDFLPALRMMQDAHIKRLINGS